MALTRRVPNQIMVRPAEMPPERIEATLAAIEAITPGMIVELHNNAGVLNWGVHDSANDPPARAVALDQKYLNHGIDTDYAAGDTMDVGYLRSGDRFYGLIASGQNVTQGAILQSNGDGRLKAYSTGVGGFVAASTVDASAGALRGWIEVQ